MIALKIDRFDEAQRIIAFKEAEGDRYLFIGIGVKEAAEIGRALRVEGLLPDTSRAIWTEMIENREALLDSIVMTDLIDGVFKTIVNLTQDGRSIDLPARPADAVAWAVWKGVPIRASEELIKLAGIILSPATVEKMFSGEAPRPGEEEIGSPVIALRQPQPCWLQSGFPVIGILGCSFIFLTAGFMAATMAYIVIRFLAEGSYRSAGGAFLYGLIPLGLIAVPAWIFRHFWRLHRQGGSLLEVFPIGIRITSGRILFHASWRSFDRPGPTLKFDPKVDGLLFKRRRGMNKGVALSTYEPNWREGQIGSLVQRYTPRLFGIEPVDPEGGSPIF
jgi:bifunctional DNase/RNase